MSSSIKNTYQIRQTFPELAYKINVFCKPKTLSRCNKMTFRNVMNLKFFSGEITETPLWHYMSGPLFKSQRQLWHVALPDNHRLQISQKGRIFTGKM